MKLDKPNKLLSLTAGVCALLHIASFYGFKILAGSDDACSIIFDRAIPSDPFDSLYDCFRIPQYVDFFGAADVAALANAKDGFGFLYYLCTFSPLQNLYDEFLLLATVGIIAVAVGSFLRFRCAIGMGFAAIFLTGVFDIVRFIELSAIHLFTWHLSNLHVLYPIQAILGLCALGIVCKTYFKPGTSSKGRLLKIAILMATAEFVISLLNLFLGFGDFGFTMLHLTCLCDAFLRFALIALCVAALLRSESDRENETVNPLSDHSMATEELLKLHASFEEGSLTQEEFEEERKKLLESL